MRRCIMLIRTLIAGASVAERLPVPASRQLAAPLLAPLEGRMYDISERGPREGNEGLRVSGHLDRG